MAEPRIVTPYAPIIPREGIAIKFYTMLKKESRRLTENEIYLLKKMMQDRITKGEIKKLCGLGFAIASENILNISIWSGFPGHIAPVAHPHLYTFHWQTPSGISPFRKENLEKAGAYCVYEMLISKYEAKALMKSWASKDNSKNIGRYLKDTLEGKLRF